MAFRFPSVFVAALALGSPAVADDNVMVVFDGSNSMWGQIDGTAKIEIARGVMDNLLGTWTDERSVGLMAYGHRTRGDCTDIEVLVQPGAEARQVILDRINAITPTGKTPLTDAVERAARELSYTDEPATVVLISDGLESCGRDPCALAEELERSGVDFTAHVVGFGLGADEDTASLACIAEKTGGRYIGAANAKDLADALKIVSTAVAEPEPEPEPTPEPEPEPQEPEAPQVTVNGPTTAVGGSDIAVTWAPTAAEGDYVTVVPAGAAVGAFGPYVRIGSAKEVSLPVPSQAGLYQMRYVSNATKETLGAAPIEVTAPEVTLTAADSVQTGEGFDIAWSPTVNGRDYVTIVPVGTKEGEFGTYLTVSRNSSGSLRAPAVPGLYELRYVLHVDKTTVTSRPIEVIDPQVTLQAPDTALTGAAFDVSWTGAVNPQDYVTIVPVGTDDGTYGNYVTVREDSEGVLRAPAEPGMYEVRYILREGAKTLATAMIEIAGAEVTLSGPDTALTGAEIDVRWTGAVDANDYVTIVPVGTDEGTYGNYVTVRDNSAGKLRVPAETGMYELRYILREGARTMATALIEVTAAEVTVTGPTTAIIGSEIEVSWTGAVDGNDYVTIVPVGTDEGRYGNYVVVRDNDAGTLTVPAETGMYELRYLLREGGKTLATAMIEVAEPEVTVSGPSTAIIGSKVEVSWTGTVSRHDYVTIVPVGTDEGTYGNYIVVRDNRSATLNMPADIGMYELRYILREGGKTLATAMIEVTEPEVTVSAPDTALAGQVFEVTWTGTVTPNDYITIVPVGTDEGEFGNYVSVSSGTSKDLQSPANPGMYEVRYVLNEGRRTVASAMIEITEPEVTIAAPDQIRAGDRLTVAWTGTVSTSDYVTIVPMGTPDGDYGPYFSVREQVEHDMTAPEETGMYEVRYMLREGDRVMARQMVEVLALDATLESGASVTAPDSAKAGSVIEVSWATDITSADQRITLARADQAIFTWISAVKIAGDPPVQMTVPKEAGTYEIRLLDVSNQTVLTRKVLTVE